MGDLSIVVNNAIISGTKIWNKPDKYRIAVFSKDENIKEISGEVNTYCGLRRIFLFAELDVLHLTEKEGSIKVRSFELKSRGGERVSVKLFTQLLKQSLSLIFVALDGFYISFENSCIFLINKLYKKPVEIEVRYLNGYSEDEIKNMLSSSMHKTLYGKSKKFSYINISTDNYGFNIKFEITLPYYRYYDNLYIPIDYISHYRRIMMKKYKDIIEEFVYNYNKKDLNEGKKLSEILTEYYYKLYLETLPRF